LVGATKKIMFDAHIHIMKAVVDPEKLTEKFRHNNVAGGALFSLPPAVFPSAVLPSSQDRLNNVLAWCAKSGECRYWPFFWIDPLEEDAIEQVDQAVAAGIAGFKVIMNRAFPSDSRAMAVFARIAVLHKPLIAHTGILWDGLASSKFTRPAEYECLLEIPGIRFSLCHMSWPWLDECLAVYGKFLNALTTNPKVSAEMFIDLTPGTPKIYRREALTKLLTIGYPVVRNIIFGTDNLSNNYNGEWLAYWRDTDRQLMMELGISESDINQYFNDNFLRFVNP